MPRRLPLAVAIGALSALSLLIALVIVAPGAADWLFASGTVEVVPWAVVALVALAAGAAILGAAASRSATRGHRR